MSSYPQSQPPRRSRKRHKPIARVTSYDYNVRYDLRRKMETKKAKALHVFEKYLDELDGQ